MAGRPKQTGYVYFLTSDVELKLLGLRWEGDSYIKVLTDEEELRRLLEMTGKARYVCRLEDSHFMLTKPKSMRKKNGKGISLPSFGGRFN